MENGNSYANGGTLKGTIGGTMLVVFTQINTADLVKTAVLAAVGASVSYLVSLSMKWCIEILRRRRKLQQEKKRGMRSRF